MRDGGLGPDRALGHFSTPEKKTVMEIFAFFLVSELQTTEVRVEIARERQGQWPYKLVCIPT